MSRAQIKLLNISTPQGPAGQLSKEARYAFNYQTVKRECEVSLVMPLRAESYAGGALPGPFLQNRPEGFLLERLQLRFAKEGGLSDMELLAYSGSAQIGRLRYEQVAEKKQRLAPQIGREALLKESASQALFEHLVDTYLLDSGVSGVQPKVLVPDQDKVLLQNKTTLLQPDLIVKTSGIDYPGLAQNEYLCMRAAERAGIKVPPFWLSDDGQLFVMERFDLLSDGSSLGFEDFSVLFGKAGKIEGKYESSYEMIAKGIKVFCQEESARMDSLQRLFEYLTLSILVRNGDAHLKNFGLLYTHPSHPAGASLSPLYDVVTTSIYDMQSRNIGPALYDRRLALKLAGSKEYPSRAELLRFAREHCHITTAEQIIERLSQAVSETLMVDSIRIETPLLKKLSKEWSAGLVSLQPSGLIIPRHNGAKSNQ